VIAFRQGAAAEPVLKLGAKISPVVADKWTFIEMGTIAAMQKNGGL